MRIEQDIEEQEQPVVEAETGQAAMEEVMDTVPESSSDKAKQEPRPDPTSGELHTAGSLPVYQAVREMN